MLEGYGYPTAESDANTYFSLTGDLAPLTASTFSIIYPDGIPLNPNAAAETGWDFEIALDISSAHTIAPGAKIVEVNANGQDDIDFLSAMGYIIDNNVGYTVSDSWEEGYEYFSGPAEGMGFDMYLQMAAAKGISFQFSSGGQRRQRSWLTDRRGRHPVECSAWHRGRRHVPREYAHRFPQHGLGPHGQRCLG